MRSLPGMKQVPLRHRALFNLSFIAEHYAPRSTAVKRTRAAARSRVIEHIAPTGKGTVRPVDRLSGISAADFRRRYLAKRIPLVLEGAARGWPLSQRWSFEQFRERYGHETIKLVQRKGLSDDDFVDEKEFSEEIGLAEFLDQTLSGGGKYMRFSPLLEKFPELLDDFDHDFFKTMSGNSWGLTYQLFIGGTGTFTPLHNAMTPFFFVNVCGIKRWALIPNHYLALLNPSADGFGYNHSGAEIDKPNPDEFPGFEGVDRMETVLYPGDVLYLPSWMWHCVQNDAPTIGVRCGFIHPFGMIADSVTLSWIRLLAARNPSTLEALYYVLVKPNLPERDKWLITPKLIRR